MVTLGRFDPTDQFLTDRIQIYKYMYIYPHIINVHLLYVSGFVYPVY